ncbi:MAG: hypothetical protein AAFU77_10490 [Myxococcota bacterium]
MIRSTCFALLLCVASCDDRQALGEPESTLLVGQACNQECPSPGNRTLVCVNGRCELADCEAGSLGCGCAPDGSCNPYYPVTVACSESGLCQPVDCAEGSLWCNCGSGCEDGASCVAGVCQPPQTRVTVAADARACSFRVRGLGVDVTYGAGLTGKTQQRGDTLGIAVASTAGGPVDGAALILTPRSPSPVSVLAAQCVDAAGRTMSDPGVRLQ